MSSTRPFFEPDGSLDTDQILREAMPLAKLIVAFLAIALVPLLFVFFVGGPGGIGALFVVIAQFVLAIGTAITLMYVITRGIALADGTDTDDVGRRADAASNGNDRGVGGDDDDRDER